MLLVVGEKEVLEFLLAERVAEGLNIIAIGLADLFHGHGILLGDLGEFVVEFGVVDEETFLGADFHGDKIGFEVLGHLGAEFLFELVFGFAEDFEVLLEGEAVFLNLFLVRSSSEATSWAMTSSAISTEDLSAIISSKAA